MLKRIYDPEKDSWSIGTPMNYRRLGLAVAVVDDLFYVLGGYEMTHDSGVRVLSNNDMYTPVGFNQEISPPNGFFDPTIIILATIIITALVGILAYFKKYRGKS